MWRKNIFFLWKWAHQLFIFLDWLSETSMNTKVGAAQLWQFPCDYFHDVAVIHLPRGSGGWRYEWFPSCRIYQCPPSVAKMPLGAWGARKTWEFPPPDLSWKWHENPQGKGGSRVTQLDRVPHLPNRAAALFATLRKKKNNNDRKVPTRNV